MQRRRNQRWRGRDRSRIRNSDEPLKVDMAGLSDLFAAPSWVRDAGFTSWLLVGITLLIAGVVWLLSMTQSIFLPLLAATVIASVAGPLVSGLKRHRVPRGVGAAGVMVLIVVTAALAAYLILAGIVSQTGAITNHLEGGASAIESWVSDLGINDSKAETANREVSTGVSHSFRALTSGLLGGIEAFASIVFFFAMTVLSLFFLLKDGPSIRAWGERHMGLPADVARVITDRSLQSLRGYFFGVSIVAAFNAVLVGGAALALGLPLAGTIALVTFFGAYIPYIGAWGAGAVSVLLALSGAGTDAAVAMIVVQLLANGPLQQIVQPIAYGATLGIHPLAVLVVTIGGGAMFGTVGLVLAAPITSAIVRISADLARSRADEGDLAPEPQTVGDT